MELEKSSFYSPGWNNDSQWEKPLDERLRGTSQCRVGVISVKWTSVLLTITNGGASKHWASQRDALGSTQRFLWITSAKTQNHIVVSLTTLLELPSICRRHEREKFNKWHYGETGRQIQNVGQLEQMQQINGTKLTEVGESDARMKADVTTTTRSKYVSASRLKPVRVKRHFSDNLDIFIFKKLFLIFNFMCNNDIVVVFFNLYDF